MGFMDKVKASVKSGAEQAATKAQEELERLQLRRELGQAHSELGEKAFELADKGDLSHGDLGPLVDKVRTLKTELESIGTAEGQAESVPPEAPPAG
jgi:hypothetical protein